MKTSFFTAPVIVAQLAAVALLVQGCTTYTPGRTALGGASTELPRGTIVRVGDTPATTTVSPRPLSAPQASTETFTKFVIPEGTPGPVPSDGLKRTAIRHVPAPAPSVEVEVSPVPASADGKYTFYVVKRGDTVGEIANRHGLTRSEFSRVNNLTNPDRILVGQKLKVPVGAKPLSAKTVASAPSAEAGVHVVASGETLSEIAAKYSMRTADLAALNGITNPNVIRLGQKLNVSKAAASAKARTEKPAAPAAAPPLTPPSQVQPVEASTVDSDQSSDVAEDPMAALLGSPSVENVVSEVPVEIVSESAPAVTKPAALREHLVRENEDIFSIAIDYRVRPMDIRRENNMSGSALTPGSVIKIPPSEPSN